MDPTLQSARNVVRIRYIGSKPKKTDNICGTDIVWEGFGDIQEVPPQMAQRLLSPKYRDVWQNADQPAPSVEQLNAKKAAAVVNVVKTHVAKQATKPAVAKEIEVRVPIEEVIDAVVSIMEEPEAEAKHVDKDGAVRLESVREKLGRKIGQKQLDEAMALIQSSGS